MRPRRISFHTAKRGKIMIGALLVALAASSIATIIIADRYVNVTLVTFPNGDFLGAQGDEPFNVSCEGIGGDAEKFTSLKWTKDGVEEMPDGDPSTVKIGNKLFLTFKNPRTYDGGFYSCSAVYDSGIELEEKIFLQFNGGKPEFLVPFEKVTLEAGKWQYLICEAEGEKPIGYKWYNEDEDRITDDDEKPIHVSNNGSHSRLNFKKLSTEHEGEYTCTASNAHGLTSKVYELRVTNTSAGNDTDNGNRTTGFQDAKVLESTSRSVTLHIATSGPVTYIEVKYRERRQKYNDTVTRLGPAPGNIYKIDNLLPSGLYSFQFRTVPPESDDWSRVYNVTLLPDDPEIIWQSIGDGSVRLQWFTKTEDILRGTINKYQIKYFSVQPNGGNSWTDRDCSVTIEVPTCSGSTYTLSGLGRNVFYQIEVRAHTEAGYSEPVRQKIFMPATRF